MTSPARVEANQANSQLSTGPTTPEGKARSAANSRTHGLCAQNVILGLEEKAEFEQLASGFFDDLHPDGQVGLSLFQELVTAAWHLRRLRRMEAESYLDAESYSALLDDEALQNKLDRLARHHTRIERTFHRCLKELKAMQNERLHAEACLAADRFKRRPMAALTGISERTQSPGRTTQDIANGDTLTTNYQGPTNSSGTPIPRRPLDIPATDVNFSPQSVCGKREVNDVAHRCLPDVLDPIPGACPGRGKSLE